MIRTGILSDKNEVSKINKYWNDLMHKFLRFDSTRTDIRDDINKFYFNTTNANNEIDFETYFQNFTNLFSDRFYFYPNHELIRIQSKHSPTYLYYNDYQGKISFTDVISATNNFPLYAVNKIGSLFQEKVLGQEAKKLGKYNKNLY